MAVKSYCCVNVMQSIFKTVMFSILLILTPAITEAFAQQANSLELEPTDDAYVINDFNDPDDKQDLQSINTGELEFLKTWYAWNVTNAENMKIISFTYLKFDLSELTQDQIVSAKLKMYAQNVTLSGGPILVDVHASSAAPWMETTLIYPDSPLFHPNPTDTALIGSIDWYEWEVTSAVKEKAGSDLTLALLLREVQNGLEEQVVFTSKDSEENSLSPKLIIEKSVVAGTSEQIPEDLSYLIVVAVIGGVGAVGFIVYRNHFQNQNKKNGSANDTDSMTILKRRLARGEISKEEYDELKKRLES